MLSRFRWLVLGAGLLVAAAYAAETITYSYDARGRLIQVARSGTVNNNVTTNYTYDKADNRQSKTTTGSPNPPPP
jgi:YD repeat-containing protein